MNNAEGDGRPTAEREWWAEISYRFSNKSLHQPIPDGPQAARERLNLGNRSFARLLETASLKAPAHMQKGSGSAGCWSLSRRTCCPTAAALCGGGRMCRCSSARGASLFGRSK